MRSVRTADIGQAEPGEEAVRRHDDIVGAGQNMGRAPGAFDDAALGPIAENDPSPMTYGRPSVNAMPEKTSLNVFCSASPRMMATTPDVATKV
jgi:hypothetical protein